MAKNEDEKIPFSNSDLYLSLSGNYSYNLSGLNLKDKLDFFQKTLEDLKHLLKSFKYQDINGLIFNIPLPKTKNEGKRITSEQIVEEFWRENSFTSNEKYYLLYSCSIESTDNPNFFTQKHLLITENQLPLIVKVFFSRTSVKDEEENTNQEVFKVEVFMEKAKFEENLGKMFEDDDLFKHIILYELKVKDFVDFFRKEKKYFEMFAEKIFPVLRV